MRRRCKEEMLGGGRQEKGEDQLIVLQHRGMEKEKKVKRASTVAKQLGDRVWQGKT